MREIVKRPRARQDLKGIWHYTFEQWDEGQATRYLLDLEQGMKRLAAHPEMGRSRDHLRPGYRSFQIARHVIFYTVEADRISIRRVLHERMDPNGNL